MNLRFTDLSQHLTRGLAPIYLLTGDEVWQVQAAKSQIIASARAAGTEEIFYFDITRDFSWDALLNQMQNFSLFSAQKLLVLNLVHLARFTERESPILDCIAQCDESTRLLLVASKLEKSATQKSWYQAVSQKGVVLTIWPMDTRQLQSWIPQYAAQHNLKLDRAAIALLANFTEGNQTSTAHEIEKLALIYGEAQVTHAQVLEAISHHSHYSVFDLSDALLTGDPVRTQTIFASLCEEGVEFTLMLWAFTRELLTLMQLKKLIIQMPLARAFSQLHIWTAKQAPLKHALQRDSFEHWRYCLRLSCEVDRIIKGLLPGDPTASLNLLFSEYLKSPVIAQKPGIASWPIL